MQGIEDIPHLGGSLALDFTNTVEPRDEPEFVDFFGERDDVIRWGIAAGLLDKSQLRPSRRDALSDASAAEELARARALRETVYAVLVAVSRGQEPDLSALVLLQGAFAQAMARSELAAHDGEYAWQTTAHGVDAVLDCV